MATTFEELRKLDLIDYAEKIVAEMGKGLSVDALPGLLQMTQDEFELMVREEKAIDHAVQEGEAKAVLYLERQALAMARDNAPTLQLLLKNRLGWDGKESAGTGNLTIELKKFVYGQEEEKDDSDSQ